MSTSVQTVAYQDEHTKALVTWGLRLIVGVVFLIPAVITLSGPAAVVNEFNALGFGPGFRIAVALVEIAAAILVLLPATSLLGAFVLLTVDVGALLLQIFVLHGGFIDVLLFVLPLLALIIVQSEGFIARLAELDS